MLVPLSEGSARAEQWEPSSVTAYRSCLHLSGAREVPLALVVGEPHNDDSRVILSRRRVVGQHWSTGTSGVL
eukprot:scaffold10281_cov31-Phaeocystis_antarctica.AAC.1